MQTAAPISPRRLKLSANASRTDANAGSQEPLISSCVSTVVSVIVFFHPRWRHYYASHSGDVARPLLPIDCKGACNLSALQRQAAMLQRERIGDGLFRSRQFPLAPNSRTHAMLRQNISTAPRGDTMTQSARVESRTEIRDGMKITWHEGIEASDGLVLRADIFRPIADGRYPVILTYGVYAKGLSYQEGYPQQWNKMVEDHPEILEGSTNKYQNWEVTDPERWVPDGYVVLRIDSRGAGWSPGVMNCNSPREIQDLYECIEWAGTQPWSNGKVGMLGISYYASNQWRVAVKHPPHLAAIIPWEGQNDRYRDSGYHGGILSQFQELWAKHQVVNIQYGKGEHAKKNPNTGESVAGPVTLSEEELARNRINPYETLKQHPLYDEWHRGNIPDLSKVEVPFLSCANWGGQGIHPRGNFNAFIEGASKQKWLEVHGDSHWALFSSGYGLALQKRFFDHFLKGIANGCACRKSNPDI